MDLVLQAEARSLEVLDMKDMESTTCDYSQPEGLVFRVWGLGFGAWGLRFRA